MTNDYEVKNNPETEEEVEDVTFEEDAVERVDYVSKIEELDNRLREIGYSEKKIKSARSYEWGVPLNKIKNLNLSENKLKKLHRKWGRYVSHQEVLNEDSVERLDLTNSTRKDCIKKLEELSEEYKSVGFDEGALKLAYAGVLGTHLKHIKKHPQKYKQKQLQEMCQNFNEFVQKDKPYGPSYKKISDVEKKKSKGWKILTALLGVGLAANTAWNYFEHRSLERDVEGISNSIEGLEGRVSGLETNFTAYGNQFQNLTGDYNNLNDSFTVFQADVLNTFSLLEESNADNYSHILDILAGDYDYARDLSDNITSLQQGLANLSQNLSNVDANLTQQIQDLQEQLNSLESLSATERQALSDQILALSQGLNETNEDVSALRTDLFTVWASLNSTQENVTGISDMLEHLVSVPVFRGTNSFATGALTQSYSWEVENAEGVDLILQIGNTVRSYGLSKEDDNFTFAHNISGLILANYVLTNNFEDLPIHARLMAYNSNGTTQIVDSGNAVLPTFYSEQEIQEELLVRSLDETLRDTLIDKVGSMTNISAKFGAYIESQELVDNLLDTWVQDNEIQTLENILNFTKDTFGEGTDEFQKMFPFFAKYVFSNNSEYEESMRLVTRCKEDGLILSNPSNILVFNNTIGDSYGINLDTGRIGEAVWDTNGITIDGDVIEFHEIYANLSPAQKENLNKLREVGTDVLLWNGVFK